METKNISIYIADNVLRELLAQYEGYREEQLQIHNITKINGNYLVDYSFRNANYEETIREGVEVEPLELIEMLNDKLNRILETLNND